MSIIATMVIDMDEAQVRTVEQVLQEPAQPTRVGQKIIPDRAHTLASGGL